ncbi:hypothetical protein PMAYCL1PPCAC_13938, partial [Pristionchus mayeri]
LSTLGDIKWEPKEEQVEFEETLETFKEEEYNYEEMMDPKHEPFDSFELPPNETTGNVKSTERVELRNHIIETDFDGAYMYDNDGEMLNDEMDSSDAAQLGKRRRNGIDAMEDNIDISMVSIDFEFGQSVKKS